MYQDTPDRKTLKVYHRHGVRYRIVCNGRYHWRYRMDIYGTTEIQKTLGKCPTTCKHHRTYAWEK